MSLVAFVSGRSPGMTTAVHALAAAWPAHRRSIVAELDPAGGMLAARYELAPEPGLTSLAVAGRRGLSAEMVLGHCRRLPSGVVALVASVGPDRVASALAVLGSELGEALDSIPGSDVLADCGRIDRRSPALEVVSASPYVVLVVAPTLEGVAHAQARLETLSRSEGRVAVLTVGDRPYRPEEVGAALQLPVLGSLADDPVGAARLNGGSGGGGGGGLGRDRAARRSEGLGRDRAARRSELRRSASVVAAELSSFLPSSAPEPHADPPTRGDPVGVISSRPVASMNHPRHREGYEHHSRGERRR